VRVAVVYNRPVVAGNDNALCSADVLAQVEAVRGALAQLGHEPALFPLSVADAPRLPEALRARGVACAFNLCESLDEDPRLQGHVAVLLELAGVPYTGSDMLALALTTDKFLAKKAMLAANIPTPRFALHGGRGPLPEGLTFPLILKPRHEDGSVGIEQDSVVADAAGLEAALKRLVARHGEILVEEYVAGRELNVGLLGYPEPKTLPVAEITFEPGAGRWPIVGYRAKWACGSPESTATPRSFPEDAAALGARRVAERCFRLFGCRDYARVDIRLAANGTPYVLEVNANPCISPEAGFAAALERAAVPYRDFVARLLAFAAERGGR
jgi:D-alanine-D-alanine ligase